MAQMRAGWQESLQHQGMSPPAGPASLRTPQPFRGFSPDTRPPTADVQAQMQAWQESLQPLHTRNQHASTSNLGSSSRARDASGRPSRSTPYPRDVQSRSRPPTAFVENEMVAGAEESLTRNQHASTSNLGSSSRARDASARPSRGMPSLDPAYPLLAGITPLPHGTSLAPPRLSNYPSNATRQDARPLSSSPEQSHGSSGSANPTRVVQLEELAPNQAPPPVGRAKIGRFRDDGSFEYDAGPLGKVKVSLEQLDQIDEQLKRPEWNPRVQAPNDRAISIVVFGNEDRHKAIRQIRNHPDFKTRPRPAEPK